MLVIFEAVQPHDSTRNQDSMGFDSSLAYIHNHVFSSNGCTYYPENVWLTLCSRKTEIHARFSLWCQEFNDEKLNPPRTELYFPVFFPIIKPVDDALELRHDSLLVKLEDDTVRFFSVRNSSQKVTVELNNIYTYSDARRWVLLSMPGHMRRIALPVLDVTYFEYFDWPISPISADHLCSDLSN